ncbi:MAG: hypothetical protein Q4F18_14945 [Clostridia bacterium]|nr:hypothetical protein [Clostridia bacterium]
MNDLKALDHLRPITDEMLAGLHADEAMRLRIKCAAMDASAPKRRAVRFTPAICCAALALVCVGVVTARLGAREDSAVQGLMSDGTVTIDTIAAGDEVTIGAGQLVADLGDGASVRAAAPGNESLFATGSGDIPMVAVDGDVYRMLVTPQDIGSSLLDGEIGSVTSTTQEPSLASADEMRAGLSNVASQGAAIYAVRGIASSTAVAAEVDGRMRVFQRVSYAGKGPGSQSLEDTFSVRGQVKTLELSGVGTLTDDAANAAVAVLLDQATLKSADASARKQTLTVTLTNGLKLQLGVSGDTLCGCGGWSCPEFFEAFEAAL